MTVLLFLLARCLTLEGRPKDTVVFDDYKNTEEFDVLDFILQSAMNLTNSSLNNINNIGEGVLDLTGDIVDSAGTTMVHLTNASVSTFINSISGVTELIKAVREFYGETAEDAGKLGNELAKSSLKAVNKATNASIKAVSDSLRRGLNNLESARIAGTKFAQNTVQNTVQLLEDSGRIVNRFTNESINSLSGY